MFKQLLIVKEDQRQEFFGWLTRLHDTPACGDCTARYELLGTDFDGMIHFKIDHDETCPWLDAMEAETERS